MLYVPMEEYMNQCYAQLVRMIILSQSIVPIASNVYNQLTGNIYHIQYVLQYLDFIDYSHNIGFYRISKQTKNKRQERSKNKGKICKKIDNILSKRYLVLMLKTMWNRNIFYYQQAL